MPRMRGRLYSSCASSTWSLPSALTRVLGEDVEDQLRAVDDARLERVLERPLLRRVRARRRRAAPRRRRSPYAAFSSSSLPLPTYVRGSGVRAVLDELADRRDAGGARELAELGELAVGVGALSATRATSEPALRLRARRGIGLARHRESCRGARMSMPDSVGAS